MSVSVSAYSREKLVEVSEEIGALVDAVAAGALDGGRPLQRLLIDLAESIETVVGGRG